MQSALDALASVTDTTNAIHVCMVLAGVRRAARLDGSLTPGFPSVLRRLARAMGKRVAFVRWWGAKPEYEPLVVDVTDADPAILRDVRVLRQKRRKYDDMEEPIVGAMQRLLGYPCPFRCGKPRTSVGFWVKLENGEMFWLGGFFCNMSSVTELGGVRSIRNHLTKQWVQPAEKALKGCIVRSPDFKIVGFMLHITTET